MNKGCRGSGKDTRPRNLSAFFPGLSYAGPLDVKPGETHYIYDFEANRSLDCTETDIADKLLVLDNSLTNIEYDCCNLFTPLGRGSVHRWSRLTTRARPASACAPARTRASAPSAPGQGTSRAASRSPSPSEAGPAGCFERAFARSFPTRPARRAQVCLTTRATRDALEQHETAV